MLAVYPAAAQTLSPQEVFRRVAPSVVVIDGQGRVRLHHFGHLDDLRLGALLGQLVGEAAAPAAGTPAEPGCDDQGCARPDLPQP